MPGLLVLHVPPVLASVSMVVKPTHTFIMPVIATGNGFTDMTDVIKQPVGNLYVIVDVPTILPVTIPVAEPISALLLLLLHVPNVVASLRFVVRP